MQVNSSALTLVEKQGEQTVSYPLACFYTQRKEAGLRLFINMALKHLRQGGPASHCALLSS